MPLVSGELAADVLPVQRGLALDILLAAAAVDGVHILHPEVIRIRPHGVDGLLEADLDFEPPTVQANNLQRVQGQIRAEEDQVPARRVAHPHKTHQLPQRAPEQVVAEIAQREVGFPIDRTGSGAELLAVAKPRLQGSFVAIAAWSPPARLASTRRWREIGDGIGAHARDQVVTLGQ